MIYLSCRHFYDAGFHHTEAGRTHQVCCLHCGDDCEVAPPALPNARGVKPSIEGWLCCSFYDLRGWHITRDDIARAIRAKRKEERTP